MSRREEERLRGKKENGTLALRMNNQEIQQQIVPRPQVWPRRQKTPQQQVPTGSVLMKGVEKTMEAMVCPQQRVGVAQRNPYAIDVGG